MLTWIGVIITAAANCESFLTRIIKYSARAGGSKQKTLDPPYHRCLRPPCQKLELRRMQTGRQGGGHPAEAAQLGRRHLPGCSPAAGPGGGGAGLQPSARQRAGGSGSAVPNNRLFSRGSSARGGGRDLQPKAFTHPAFSVALNSGPTVAMMRPFVSTRCFPSTDRVMWTDINDRLIHSRWPVPPPAQCAACRPLLGCCWWPRC